MNKTARASATFKADPRRHHIVWMDETEADFDSTRGHVASGVLHLEGAAPNGEILFLPVNNIRYWYSDQLLETTNQPSHPQGQEG